MFIAYSVPAWCFEITRCHRPQCGQSSSSPSCRSRVIRARYTLIWTEEVTVPYRVVQPWGKDRAREATENSVWASIADAFAEIDRYAARVKTSRLPGDHLELIVVDDEGREVRRPGPR